MLYSTDEIKIPSFFAFHVIHRLHLLQICHWTLPSRFRFAITMTHAPLLAAR